MTNLNVLSRRVDFSVVNDHLRDLGLLNHFNIELFVESLVEVVAKEILSDSEVKKLLFFSPEMIKGEKVFLQTKFLEFGFDTEVAWELASTIFAIVISRLSYEP